MFAGLSQFHFGNQRKNFKMVGANENSEFAKALEKEYRTTIMRFVVQRVSSASCDVDGQTVGSIKTGFMVLIGISNDDTTEIADKMIKKLIGLRIFEDANGKTNLSLYDVDGELLLISQFTLYADCRKGNRPSFINAGKPDMAKELYGYIIDVCKGQVSVVEQGIFGADMKISLLNDGPFTIILDSDEICSAPGFDELLKDAMVMRMDAVR